MYDVVIIGGGPAGYNGALRCASLGLKTALIEKRDLGGTCLNRGCIPTKSLLKSAEVYQSAKNSEMFGVSIDNVVYDIDKIYLRKNQVVEKLKNGLKFLIKKSGLDYFEGQASFIDKNTIVVKKTEDERILKAKNIVIATGSLPAKLNLEGIEFAKNSDDVLEKGITGQEIVIIGGGVIGCEFACFLSSLGKKVTIVEMEKRILPLMDRDISNYLAMTLKKQGVIILTNAKVGAIKKDNGNLSVIVDAKGDKTIYADEVIVSIGRCANIMGLDLENAGVKYDRTIQVNGLFQTNVSNIYAVGDVTSKIQLAHLAEAQAVNVAYIIVNKKPIMNLNIVPNCVFTSPEIASVGTTEKLEGYTSSKIPIGCNGKAVIEDSLGFVKTVYDKDNIIVGGIIMCSRATDMIAELALAIVNKLTKEQLAKTIHAHPTLSETIRQTADI